MARGYSSIALGQGVLAQSAYSTALGFLNSDDGDSIKWDPTDPILTVGNGYNNKRANALTILKNGLVLIGTEKNALNYGADPSTKLAVMGLI